ncbi:MAG TPA: hypothetical protein VMG30_09235 [Acidobacteriota bacterium]|nr:hypothetical protein [Acidobacteriota bacterium]
MSKKADKLTSSQQTEDAGIRLFNRIDRGVHEYIASADGELLEEQAMRNAIAMLDILKTMYQNDFRLRSIQISQGVTACSRSYRDSPEKQWLRQ